MLAYTKTFPGWKMIFDVYLLRFHLLSFSLRWEFLIYSDRQPQASKLYQRRLFLFTRGKFHYCSPRSFRDGAAVSFDSFVAVFSNRNVITRPKRRMAQWLNIITPLEVLMLPVQTAYGLHLSLVVAELANVHPSPFPILDIWFNNRKISNLLSQFEWRSSVRSWPVK